MKSKVFVDGAYGTVGLNILSFLKAQPKIEIIEIPYLKRKDISLRKSLIEQADLVTICLPNRLVKSAVDLVPESTKILDCSTEYRCNEKWVYGLPELKISQRRAIQASSRVSNPGCFALAFILAIRPLVSDGLISEKAVITAFALTGYSAGGRRMIKLHKAGKNQEMFHSLDMNHKHLPEMKKYSKLLTKPLFIPAVGAYKEGLILTVPLSINSERDDLIKCFTEIYHQEKHIIIHESCPNSLGPRYPSHNQVEFYIGGMPGSLSVTVKFNNLVKGAAGNAMQCIKLMLGIDECTESI